MPRDLPLANGHMLVNFDSNYNLRDIYWPHIGESNHTQGHVNHTGIWIDGRFSWFDAPDWQRDLRYEPDTLVTAVTLTNADLQVVIDCTDAVDFDRDLLIRKLRVRNTAGEAREMRLFFHQDWHLWEAEGANTVYYDPRERAVIAYKDRCNMLVNGLIGGEDAGAARGAREAEEGVRYWATGYKEFNGQQGTWLDAEDGVLGGNAIAQGSVDSCVGFHLGTLAPGATRCCYQWIAAGEDYPAVRALNALVMERGPESLIERTHNYWHLWLTAKPIDGADLSPDLIDLYKRSLLVVRTQIDDDGAIVAATDGDVWTFARDSYAYMWPRDGALVATVLTHAGYGDITGAFFHFCRQVITEGGYLLHKYTPRGAVGSSWQPWIDTQGNPILPIQEDETALVVYALWQHYQAFHEVEFIRPLYRPLVKAAADFMVAFRDPITNLPHPTWDLWEERRGVHAYTVAAVYGGLQAAANFAEAFGEDELATRYRRAAAEIKVAARQYLWHNDAGRFVRTLYVSPDGVLEQDMNIDASIVGICKFDLFDANSEEMLATMATLTARLTIKSDIGGVARYENDYYHQVSQDLANVPGNPWFICACWLAEYQIGKAKTLDELRQAQGWLEWVRARALPSGVLAEQVHPYTGAPLSVSPLTWSHAEFASAIRWYIGKYRRLSQAAQ